MIRSWELKILVVKDQNYLISPPCDLQILPYNSVKTSNVKTSSKDKSSYDDDVITKSMNKAYDRMYFECVRINESCKRMQA